MKIDDLEFISFDIETANDERSSICQIGMAKFINGTVVEKWSSLIQPQVDFSSKNIQIHGITPDHVIYSPTFEEIYPKLKNKLNNSLCISHSTFDIQAFSSVIKKYGLPKLNFNWLDSYFIAKRVWPNLNSHSLNSLAINLELLPFNHHDALDDALTCGHIFLRAIKEKPHVVDKLVSAENHNIIASKQTSSTKHGIIKDNSFFSKISRKKVTVEPNKNGFLFGKHIVFTGSLSISRKEAATLAANVGCEVKSSVTKKTSFCIVGIQDLELTKGRKRSSKHRKAEKYFSQGLPIKILSEQQFFELIDG